MSHVEPLFDLALAEAKRLFEYSHEVKSSGPMHEYLSVLSAARDVLTMSRDMAFFLDNEMPHDMESDDDMPELISGNTSDGEDEESVKVN